MRSSRVDALSIQNQTLDAPNMVASRFCSHRGLRLLDPVAGHRAKGEALSFTFTFLFLFKSHHPHAPLAWDLHFLQATASPFLQTSHILLPRSGQLKSVLLLSVSLLLLPKHLFQLRCILRLMQNWRNGRMCSTCLS